MFTFSFKSIFINFGTPKDYTADTVLKHFVEDSEQGHATGRNELFVAAFIGDLLYSYTIVYYTHSFVSLTYCANLQGDSHIRKMLSDHLLGLFGDTRRKKRVGISCMTEVYRN